MQKTYVWTEDSRAGYKFWKTLFAQLVPEAIVETKKNNSELVKAVSRLKDESNKYVILMDQAFDNPQVVREQKRLSMIINDRKNIFCIKIISFEYLLLQFNSLIDWVFASEDNLLEQRKNLKDIRERLIGLINGNNPLSYINDDSIKGYFSCLNENNIEQICARVLFDITRNTGFEVSKRSVGPCWIMNCCDWIDRADDDICGLNENRLSVYGKMYAIFTNTSVLCEGFKAANLEVKRDYNL